MLLYQNTLGVTFKLNLYSYVKSTWLQPHCLWSLCSNAHFHLAAQLLKGQCITTLAYVPRNHLDKALICLDFFCPKDKNNCIYSWVALLVHSQQAVNRIYQTSVSVIAGDWPFPSRHLTFPVPWNWFHSLTLTFHVTPIVSTILCCVCPTPVVPSHGFY